MYLGRVLPLAFCLLVGKTTGHYRQALQAITRKVRAASGHRWRPRRVICDFEHVIMSAIETELPTARVSGCYFHFCQSLWRHVQQEVGLCAAYRQNQHVRRVMALGHLPLAIVRQNFMQFLRSRRTRRLFRREPSLREFASYVRRTYFDGPFDPAMWNVNARNMDTRTNNHVEGRYRAGDILSCTNIMKQGLGHIYKSEKVISRVYTASGFVSE